MPININIQYFAILREQRGLSQESCPTQSRTAAELYKELQSLYAFSLPASLIKVAVNNEFVEWNCILQPNDTIVFIPPVAGG